MDLGPRWVGNGRNHFFSPIRHLDRTKIVRVPELGKLDNVESEHRPFGRVNFERP